MNKNSKGFMLLETLIVSTIILSTLIFLFVQFTNIKSSYEISFKYNTVPGIYLAKELSDFLVENEVESFLSNELSKNAEGGNGYILIDSASQFNNIDSTLYKRMLNDMDIKHVIYTTDSMDQLKAYLNSDKRDSTVFTESFKEFIFSLKSTNTSNNRLVIMFNNKTFASIIIGIDSVCVNGQNAICFKYEPKDTNWKVTNVHEALEYLRKVL